MGTSMSTYSGHPYQGQQVMVSRQVVQGYPEDLDSGVIYRKCPGIGSCPVCQSMASGAEYDMAYTQQHSGGSHMHHHHSGSHMMPSNAMSSTSNAYMSAGSMQPQSGTQYSRVLLNPPTFGNSPAPSPSAQKSSSYSMSMPAPSSSCSSGCAGAQFVLESAGNSY